MTVNIRDVCPTDVVRTDSDLENKLYGLEAIKASDMFDCAHRN